MIPSVKGAFGRQARYRHGPLPVLRTAHPISLDFLQLPSTAHKFNLLQYLTTPGVSGVLADRQLPGWVGAYLPRQGVHRAQLVELSDGGRLIVQLHREKGGDAPQRPVVQQLHAHLWTIERSCGEVESPHTLNSNLEMAGQVLKSHCAVDLGRESSIVVDALSSSRGATLQELAAHFERTLGRHDDLKTILRVVVSRLLFKHRLSVNLTESPWSDQSRVVWGGHGVGFCPPMPSGAGGIFLAGEAA
jgi:hypothetical protein